ncbi:hypothetical protein IFM89_025449 [Coptis chinensis]|uniref:Uncharacterized protein n=1 Tax=Coptis chinensis TaxID=261450 RepID=A0A835M1M2_9MAGN|nr:hypothetical protein IFM89_025449 [Coptis chinensis]
MDPGENSDSDSYMGVDETSDTPMEVNNTQDSSVERTGRGAVQCKRITKMREGELLNVQYNEDGQRIEEGGKDLASYSGLLAESRISIVDYENWHAVGDEVRDLLWDTIKAKFNLTEDEKKGVVSDIGEKLKEFKSRLTRYYITPYKDQPEKLLKPPKKHEKNIRQEDWERFVKSRLTPKFQVYNIKTMQQEVAQLLLEELRTSTSNGMPPSRSYSLAPRIVDKLARRSDAFVNHSYVGIHHQ